MLYFAQVTIGPDEDEIWVAVLSESEDPAANIAGLRQLLLTPEAEINRIRREMNDKLPPVDFSENMPMDYLVTYDQPDGLWALTGVYTSNHITIHAPRSRALRANNEGFVSATIETDDPTVHVRLLEYEGPPQKMGLGHFNPITGDDLFHLACAKFIYDPANLRHYLAQRLPQYLDLRITDLLGNDVTQASGKPKLEHRISPLVQIHIQELPQSSPCYPVDPRGNCVKYAGTYSINGEGEDRTATLEVSEIFRLPYCVD